MRISIILLLFVSLTTFAQSKVGTIDVDYVLSKMPEIKVIQTQVEDYGKELDADFNKKLETYNAMVQAYTDGESEFTIGQKKQKQEEILATEQDLNKFQENGTKLINLRRDELVRPLYQKIGVSLEKIARDESFTQVLQLNGTIVYIDENYDLTDKVLTDLGIALD